MEAKNEHSPEKNQTVIDGQNLISCRIHYENITVRDDKGNIYFLPPETLISALSEFLFKAYKKRTRTWLETIDTKEK